MELKEYQQRASDRLDVWLETLEAVRIDSDNAVEALAAIGQTAPGEVSDYPRKTWKALKESHQLPDSVLQRGTPHARRTTGSGLPLPHVCLKIPTGGGKTLMGAVAIERILRSTKERTGLVLWIVPTNAIYTQTKAALWDREHPYRQRLELACGGRVKVMEKEDALSKLDVDNHLCVMLLMFPSVNQQERPDFLRINRDSGRYSGFFPEDGNAYDESTFAKAHPSLDLNLATNRVKQSLSNVIRVSRPIVVLDEAHKAYGGSPKRVAEAPEFARKISELDPSYVVELTATPNSKVSNLLVDVTGKELHDEQMIKLPIQVRALGGNASWQHTLTVARERLDQLTATAEAYEAESGRYIRPIAVVRAENTGKDQRKGTNIHIEDVREELINQGVDPSAIRVKSSTVDELGREDLTDALHRSPVQWILTKDALKEGWDCPFAYVLVLLDKTRANRPVTQMVGRVMRMPHVSCTQLDELDECYVICHDVDVRHAVESVRADLQEAGMGDVRAYVSRSGRLETKGAKRIKRRKRFRGIPIYLPKVLRTTSDGAVRDLDYDQDILSRIDWSRLRVENPQAILAVVPTGGVASLDELGETRNLEDRIELISDTDWLSYFTYHLSSAIPNPWVCATIANDAVERIESEGSLKRSDILVRRSVYAEQFRRNLLGQIDRQAKAEFTDMLNMGELSFDLEALEGNYEICEVLEASVTEGDGRSRVHLKPVQSSLFKPVFKRDFNEYEEEFAIYLDSQKAISWWHRVAASQRSGYYLRGWRRERVFPDFVAVASTSGDPADYRQQLLIFETKGGHLKDNDDSRYKSCLLDLLQDAYNDDLATRGKMRIKEGELKGVFKMVIQGQHHEALAGTLAA